jgi:tRNA A-37 threonylcarbamoyl transferase component Bud32
LSPECGDTLSRYQLVEKIGEGGMGVVFRAQDETLKRDVAVKVLMKGALADDAARRRFLNEALALSRLNHPNVETVYDFGSQGGEDFLVLELLPGPTLKQRLDEGALGEQETLVLGIQLAQGLGAAHDQGIIHRDLKPGNVTITVDGRVKILDFGLARLARRTEDVETTRSLTQDHGVSGTFPYMAPEQLLGQEVDARTDIHALGAVLYEMATGQRAFEQELMVRLTDAILHHAPPAPRSVRPEISAGLEAVILRCLEKRPERRYASAREIELDLRGLRDRVSSRTRTVAGLPRPTGRKRRGVLVAVVGLASVVAVASWVGVQRGRDNRAVRELVESLQPLADGGDLDEVDARLRAAGVDIADHRVASLAEQVGGSLTVRTDPPGAVIEATRVKPIVDFAKRTPIDLGTAPVSRLLVAGEYLLRVRAPQRDERLRLIDVKPRRTVTFEPSPGSAPPGMVLVPAGPSPLSGDRHLGVFLIDRHEVANEAYQAFVAARGYDDATLWPETMRVGGRPLARDAALARFVDRTGLAGPRDWSNGTFPDRRARHPVTGISWHEAAAYARWAGKRLPTRDEWWRAALEDTDQAYPWGDEARTAEQRANFGVVGTEPVESNPLGVSPSGCFDMAGNVQEWVADVADDSVHRVAVGGSWKDPVYLFHNPQAQHFDPGFADDTIGLRLAQDPPD